MLEVAKGKYAEERFSHATMAGKEESDYWEMMYVCRPTRDINAILLRYSKNFFELASRRMRRIGGGEVEKSSSQARARPRLNK